MIESTSLLSQENIVELNERVTSVKCGVCGLLIKHGQIISGARITLESDEIVGHYACIIQVLGPEKALKAILAGQLPAIDPTSLVDGRVPGWEKLFGDDPR